MASALSKDLFLAILAMNAYNRGYDSGILLPQSATSGIGNATLGIATNSETQPEAVAASFFAQAYTLNNQTIISYRGTDNLPVDTLTGYGTGAGIPFSPCRVGTRM